MLLPPAIEILHLANGHMDEYFFYEDDPNIHSDDRFCLFDFNLNNQSSVLNEKTIYNFQIDNFSTIEINEIISYPKNSFTQRDKRGPPFA